MTDSLRAYLSLAFGLLCIGFSAIFVSWANAPGAVTGFYRMAIAVLVLGLPFLRRQGERSVLPRREVGIALAGGLFFASDLIFWNTGVLLGGATNPTLMGNTAPIWVGLGALIFFRERLPVPFWVDLPIAVGGAAVIIGVDVERGPAPGLGTLFGLIAGIFYGAYFLVTQRSRRRLDALSNFWLGAVSATVALAIAAVVLDQPLAGYNGSTYLNFLALGLIVQVGGQFAFSYALGYLPASVVSPVGPGQPVVTALLAWPLLGEEITTSQTLGELTVLTGVFIVHRSRARRPALTPSGESL
ncbi:MAG: DMT family transporter [Anaerolineae bacterium]|nr:DMT family transporter [Anaerolineae bacterium]